MLPVLLPAATASCGAEASIDDPTLDSREEAQRGDGEEPRDVDQPGADDGPVPVAPELAEALELEAMAPGYTEQIYPAPPYGFTQGSVIANYEFLGWSAPSAVGYDLEQLETLNLASFYDPDGIKGIELLMINAVAVWCGVCQSEYLEIRESGVYHDLRDRGFEMLGVLFEDADSAPARYADLQNWSRAFDVDFAFVMDPSFQLGSFFDRSATPMNMVVDARTMEVLVAMTGYNPEIFQLIDRELTARGR